MPVEYKKCSKCHIVKDISEFGKHKSHNDGLRSECKACACKVANKWHKENPQRSKTNIVKWRKANPEKIKACSDKHCAERRKTLDKAKDNGCVFCGYNRCLAALDFHHVQLRTNKRRMINLTPAGIKEEIKVCILVCANCHRELHDIERRK